MGCESSLDAGAERYGNDVRRALKKGRVNVALPNDIVFENVKVCETKPGTIEKYFLYNTIVNHFLFYRLAKQERKYLAGCFYQYYTDGEHYVFKQDSEASLFFVVYSGRVRIEVGDKVIRELGRGSCFGELALLYAAKRSASVYAVEKCRFLCLSHRVFAETLQHMVKSNFNQARLHVQREPFFSFLSVKQRNALAYNAYFLKYEQGEVVFRNGDDASAFYIVIEGLVTIDIPGKDSVHLKAGESFGEGCLTRDSVRAGIASCTQTTTLISFGREDLLVCLGGSSAKEVRLQNTLKWGLRRESEFYRLSAYNYKRMIDLGNIRKCKDGTVIVQADETCDRLYMSLYGEINYYNAGVLIHKEYIMPTEVRSFTPKQSLIKKGDGFIYWIRLCSVYQILSSGRVRTVNSKKQEKAAAQSKAEVRLNYLSLIKKLGTGKFGVVYLVERNKTERFALKCMEKNNVINAHMYKFVESYRSVLSSVSHPLLTYLRGSYRDKHQLYLLLNYIEGGDFFELLRETGVFTVSNGRFFVGCMVLCLYYLHEQRIIYRDLKPYNMAVDSKGYLHLIDMGAAKQLGDGEDRTFTMIGTPHYMAPEIVEGKGYSLEADLWSMGVVVYEMMCNKLPFGHELEDPTEIYQDIIRRDVVFPRWFADLSSQQLICRLMLRRPEARAIDDFHELRSLEFFAHFSWSALESRTLEAPLLPKIPLLQQKSREPLLPFLHKQIHQNTKLLSSKLPNWDYNFYSLEA